MKANGRISESSCWFESLEPRLLLSASPVITEQFDLELGDRSAIQVLGDFETDMVETTQLMTYDAGDSYWYFDQEIPLLRVAGSLVLSLEAGLTSEDVLVPLTVEGGILSDYDIIRDFGRGIFKVEAKPDIVESISQISTETLKDNMGGVAGIGWVAPLFVNSESGYFQFAADEIIIKLANGVHVEDVLDSDVVSYERLGGTADQFVLKLDVAGEDVLAAAVSYAKHPDIQRANPNFYHQIVTCDVDPLYSDQWHLNNTGQSGATSDADVDAPEAWADTAPDSDIVIAILDSGVETDHPDLNIWVNPGEYGNDEDDNGWTNDVNGWDFYDYDNDPNPSHADDNHGTAVAGVAAAIGGNQVGGKGMSYGSEIMALKIKEGDYATTVSRIAESIRYAAGFTYNGQGTWKSADILNCSWEMPIANETITNAFNDAATDGRGGLGLPIFVSAGNSASGYGNWTTGDVGAFAGTWSWVISYEKDASLVSGSDTVWLGKFTNSDDEITCFDSSSPPSGWSMTPFVGEDGWSIQDDPSHAYGTGRYQAKAATIGNSDVAYIMAPEFTITGTTIPAALVTLWRSSHASETINFQLWNYDLEQLYNWGTISGANPSTANGISYPASLSSTIAVGASTDFDYRSDYSQYGTGLDFVAPSNGGYAGITTTDRTGTDGYNTTTSGNGGDYYDRFSGTSSASPLAAGIGALLLSKNPNLTDDQIRTIMRDSADEIGSVTYVEGFNQYYGYGRVNAEAALDLITDAPTVVDLVAGDNGDTGKYTNDDLTKLDNYGNTLEFTVSGTIDGAAVTLYDGDGDVIGTGTGDVDGVITITTNGSHALADGAHSITARQTVNGKQPSDDSEALTITVDATAPTVPDAPDLQAASDLGSSSTDNITKDNTPTFDISGVSGGDYFRFYRDTTQISDNYETTIPYTTDTQNDGEYDYSLSAVDEAGNESNKGTALADVKIDTVAPEVSGSPVINDGATQRDSIRSIEFTFNENVSVTTDALQMYYYYDDGDSWETTSLSSPTFSQPAANKARWSNSSGLLTVDDTHLMAQLLSSSNLTDIAGNQIAGDEVIDEDLFDLHKLSGDIDGDRSQSVADINTLFSLFGNAAYDLDGDNDVDIYDVIELVVEIFETFMGDGNLDGEVDVGDLGILSGNLGTTSGMVWEDGDFNGDGAVDVGDLGILSGNYNSINEDFGLIDLGVLPDWP